MECAGVVLGLLARSDISKEDVASACMQALSAASERPPDTLSTVVAWVDDNLFDAKSQVHSCLAVWLGITLRKLSSDVSAADAVIRSANH